MGRQCGVITSTVCKDYRGKERKGSFWGTLPQGESSQERIRGWGRGLHYTCCQGAGTHSHVESFLHSAWLECAWGLGQLPKLPETRRGTLQRKMCWGKENVGFCGSGIYLLLF